MEYLILLFIMGVGAAKIAKTLMASPKTSARVASGIWRFMK